MSAQKAFEDQLKSLGQSLALPPKVQGELTLEERESRSLSWGDKKPRLSSFHLEEGVSLRVLDQGKEGVATTRNVSPASVSTLIEAAVRNSRYSTVDNSRAFQKPSAHPPVDIPSDINLFKKPMEEVLGILENLERSILKYDHRIKKVVKLDYREIFSRLGLSNSSSLFLSSESSYVMLSVEVLAEEGHHTEAAWEVQSRRFAKALPVEHVAQSVAERVVKMLGGGPIQSGVIPVLLSPRVGTQLLSLLSNALSAEAVQHGRSFLKNKKGVEIASAAVQLIDDPFLSEGVASAPFDDEGTPHETLTVIENGTLRDYFYDLRSANRERRESNGHGIRASLASSPRPGPTNLYIKAGRADAATMTASGNRVFQVDEVLGLHMADPITGEFSFGAMGALYEKGKFSKPVRGVTIASSVGDFLKNIIAVGDDLTWYGSFGSPSLLVSNVTVGGT